ncbi:MAG: acetamidase [Clostridiales bacterium]|nr:acetamidase [Clostridiales bacterium]
MQIVNQSVLTFSADNPPFAKAASGEVLKFVTMDCFSGQLTSADQLVHHLDLSTANPAAGPVYIEGALPGDLLAVDILDIAVADRGFACAITNKGPIADLTEARTKIIPIEDGYARFNDLCWPIRPMVGVIGTAPAEGSIACGFCGDHGGNMDNRLIQKGVRVYLPVRVEGALLQLGDLHASMGDGEVSGTGIEIAGEVLARVQLIKDCPIHWPVLETADRWYVNTVAPDYDGAIFAACRELARLMEPAYGWDATDILIYFSLQGGAEINQSARPNKMLTFRYGVPKLPGKRLLPEA